MKRLLVALLVVAASWIVAAPGRMRCLPSVMPIAVT